MQALNVGEEHCGVRGHRVQDEDGEGAGSDHGASQAVERGFHYLVPNYNKKEIKKKPKSIPLKATLAARGDGPVDNRGQDGVGGMMELETRDI